MTVNFQASARPNRGPLKLGRSTDVPEESSEDTIPMSDFELVSGKNLLSTYVLYMLRVARLRAMQRDFHFHVRLFLSSLFLSD